MAAPILLWILFREGGPFLGSRQAAGGWRRWVLNLFTLFPPIFLGVNVGLAAFAAPYGHVAGIQGLNVLLRPGDVVGTHGLLPDLVLPYVPEGVCVVPYRPGFDSGFLVTAWDVAYEGFAPSWGSTGVGTSSATSTWSRCGSARRRRGPCQAPPLGPEAGPCGRGGPSFRAATALTEEAPVSALSARRPHDRGSP